MNMRRKLVKQGGSALTVSLPAKWIKQKGLAAGDEVEVEEKDKEIRISSGKSEELERVSIKVHMPSKLIRRHIGNLYRRGYDEMEFKFDDPAIIHEIQKYMPDFMGLEITKQKKDSCIVKDLTGIKQEEFDNAFRRLFLITLSMAEESIEAVKKKDYDAMSNILILEKTTNKLFNFCLRIVNKYWDKNVYFMGKLLIRLEDIGDGYRDICKYLMENKKVELSAATFKLYNELNVKLKHLYDLYYSFPEESINHIFAKKETLTNNAGDLFEKVPKKEIIVIHYLLELVSNIYEASSPIFGINE